jgi:hypothetical protein
VYDAIFTEERNKPAVVLVTNDFVTDSMSARSSRGWSALRVVSESVPPECTVIEKINAGIDAVMDDIIAALTKPLTEEEKSPKPKEIEKPARIIFKGNLEEVNQFFYKRGWGDGLPIIPPTEEAVAEMLTGTDLPADHVVTKIIPRLGKATVEKIAINAVMGGALPTYMPILITAVQALMEPQAGFGTTEVSTASWVPFYIINGPIRHDLHVNSGQGALSPGDIANAAIGRSMGLIVKNIGGARKGIEDMGIFGNPGKYTMVIAENEEESPWEPLHVEHGFKKEDSTVTVSFPTGYMPGSVYGSDAEGIMRGLLSSIRARSVTLILQPQHARSLAEGGWTKKEMASFIHRYARIPAYQSQIYYGNWGPTVERQPLNAMDPVPVLGSPNSVRTIVAGGAGGLMVGLATGTIGWLTKKVELPSNWDKLVAKYKNLVPHYVMY